MEQLPHELVERVCEFLTLDDLKKTLTVSSSFQYASERASGAYAHFDLTRDNAQQFIDLYNGRRWPYLRHVRFRTQLPPYEEDEQADEADEEPGETHRCRESLEERQEKDTLFTDEINFVFSTLRTLEHSKLPGNFQLTIYAPVREVRGVVCAHRNCVSWRLHLKNPDALPQLNSVRALSLEDEILIFPLEEERCLQNIDLRILIDLAEQLPRLEYLGCKVDGGRGWTPDYESEEAREYLRDWEGPHRDSRHDFAKALESATLPSTLRQAQLDFLHPLSSPERIDQTIEVPDLVSPAQHDPFSSSLRLLSYQLRKLELKLVADASLFWPADSATSWPNLESVSILFHMSSPSGRWYFAGPNGDGRDTEGYEVTEASYPPLMDTLAEETLDEEAEDHGFQLSNVTCNKFRVQPNDEVLVPFLTAFARAASSMPVLKEACIWTKLRWDASDVEGYDEDDGTQYAQWPDEPLAWGITFHYSKSRQLWWSTGHWRPDGALRQLFQDIGDKTTELIEYWGHERYGEGLPLRPIFDQFDIFGEPRSTSKWPVKAS
ncbi:hypothetical protein CC86DRAFT_302458 [Ophiobolus disseminans]|uniref:F-box domain-containing protein n=1 Tax=Ophiobolus disseminans TaxID=1469910 RepID=A0A6A6ZN43_9PLEO|nr:hypothetical protein CC86DRAFT_302458 [Ophiobolus disseminans]